MISRIHQGVVSIQTCNMSIIIMYRALTMGIVDISFVTRSPAVTESRSHGINVGRDELSETSV